MRAKEQVMGAKKHEAALRELARRKQDNEQARKRATAISAAPRVQVAKKGISAGVKSKNRHIQDFEKMKSGFRKRKGERIVIA